MARKTIDKTEFHSHNKSDKPDNIVQKENDIFLQCEALQHELPAFMRPYFTYLKGNVLPMTRLAYLHDVKFFLNYLINETDLTDAAVPKDIRDSELGEVEAQDVNLFLDYCRRYVVDNGDTMTVFENNNRSLARKKSSISVLFKQLYRDGILEKNITDGFDPVKVPKPGEREIKALQDDEVMIMLDAVSSGSGLTPHERSYWERTKLRDKAILVLFVTYGLRLSELQQLNVSSFNFSRGEFKIYRKRGKESLMPINRSVEMVLTEYISTERTTVTAENTADEDALVLSLQGKRMTERAIRELVKKYTSIAMGTSRKSGYSPHKLRATAATSLINRGNSIYDVQTLLDHEQVTTTQLYAQHRMDAKRDLVKDMDWELERKDEK
ncbi:MAG: tyrosine-type recombinase/integrase [Mogibacterium sp.]|nr:tyrosine-type recombinase/integrase [Mogibacterium sp.]